MRNFLFILLITTSANAQQATYDSVNLRRNQSVQKGMLALSAWSVGNIAWSFAVKKEAIGDDKYFHRMNRNIGLVNLGLSQFGYWSARRNSRKTLTPSGTFAEQQKAEKLFLFNAGLDLAYVATGGYLTERSRRFDGAKSDRLKGYGRSVMLQGGFLTLFDGVLFLVVQRAGRPLQGRLQQLSLRQTADGIGVTWTVR